MHEFSGTSIPPEDHNLNYYQEYCRLFIANVVLTTQMRELTNEKLTLEKQLESLEKQINDLNSKEGSEDDKKKRFRRSAKLIERHFKCPISSCQKSYGSEGSLNQHMKLKHQEFYSENFKQEDIKDEKIDEDQMGEQQSYSNEDDEQNQEESNQK